jgi:hypothetical protein
MKVVKILLGLIFGAWSLGTLVLGIRDLEAPAFSPRGLGNLAAVVGGAAILACLSAWSFQSAFRRRARSQDEFKEKNAASTDEPQSSVPPDQLP